MRDIICEVVSQEQAEDPKFRKLFKELVECNRNSKYFRELEEEIWALSKAVSDAQARFPEEKDFIALGDFNADCSYFDKDSRGSLTGES